ncbi:hypothetical protein ACLM5H_05185 [Fredinandcohnia humi]
MKLDNVKLNSLALAYANSNGENVEAFNELFEGVRKLIEREAYKREQRTGIAREDFESVFSQAVWEAALDYNGSSNFVQRLMFFFDREATDLHRKHKSAKRSLYKSYSMDNAVDEEGNTFADLIPSQVDVETEVIEKETTKKLLEGFGETNERYAKVIQLISKDCTNEEIAEELGSTSYDAKTRKIVQRAKNNFKKFYEEQIAS